MVMKMKWLLCMMLMVAALVTTAQAGVVLYYDFEGDSTTAGDINDQSGNGYDGSAITAGTGSAVIDGTTPTAGAFAGSKSLALTGDFGTADNSGWVDVDTPGYTGIGGTAARTISFWINMPDTTDNFDGEDGNIFTYGTGATTGGKCVVRMDERAADDFAVRFEIGGGSMTGDIVIDDGTWHHVAVVYDGADGTIYVDGVVDLTKAMAVNTVLDTNFRIGAGEVASNYPGGRNFNGNLDDVALFDVALSASNIAGLAAGTFTPTTIPATPIVNAGSDQDIDSLSTSVTATATDPGGLDMTYAWTADDVGVTIDTPTALTTTVTLPAYGTYELTLTATNSIALVGSDSVTVTASDPTVPDVYIVGRWSRGPMQTFLETNFPAGTFGTISGARYNTSRPAARAQDLVIFIRETSAGDYDDGEAEVIAWNDIPAPMLMMAPGPTRKQNFGYATDNDQPFSATAGNETLVLSPSDPLFAGVTIDINGYANLNLEGSLALKCQTATSLAGHTVLAEGLDGTTPTARLARIKAGSGWESTEAAGLTGTHGGPRIVFYGGKDDRNLGVFPTLTADGLLVLKNCIQDLLDEKNKPVVNAGSYQAITTFSADLVSSVVNPDPNDPLTYLWTSSDAAVSFVDDEDPNTTAIFADYGLYELTLTATNTIPLSSSSSFLVFVIDPEDASAPNPEFLFSTDGETGVVTAPTLSWTAGADAVTRDVWFGKDAGDMDLVLDDVTDLSYAPGTLVKGQTYYWAVDETDSGLNLHLGTIWSFTVAPLSGATNWVGGVDPNDPTDNLWSTEANWDPGVPGIGNQANIYVNGPALIDSTVEAVATGTWTRMGLAAAITEPNLVPTVLNMTGGSLTVKNWALGNTGPAVVNISGGTVTANIVIIGDTVDIGEVTLNISGGTVNVGGELRLYDRAHSRINLTGGVLYAKDIRMYEAPGRSQTIDLAGGKLVMPGDQTVELNSIVGHPTMVGFIAFDGTGSVMVSYDEVADETTVAGCAYALTSDASGDCIVNEDDLEVLAADWLYTTPLEAQWSFDMASDPVGTGEWDLVVRGDDPANANYTMGDDTGTGTLEVTGAGTFLVDQQYQGTIGAFDTDVHYVIKSTNEYAVDLWIYMATSSVEGRQSAVGISTMLEDVVNPVDPNFTINVQTVEIWGGLARQQGGYAPPVVETGFDADAYLTIDVNYDYDTDTYDWSISDGSETRVGFDVSYPDTGNGDGGAFTIKSGTYGNNALPGSALIDQFDVTIHGSALVIKPGDADRDGDVDLSDFAALAAEWLLDGTL